MMEERYGKKMKFGIVIVRVNGEQFEKYINASVQYGAKDGKEGFYVDDEFYPGKTFDFSAS